MCDFQEEKKTYICVCTHREGGGGGLIFQLVVSGALWQQKQQQQHLLMLQPRAEAAAAALQSRKMKASPSINSPRLPPSTASRRLDDKDKYLGWTEELLRPPAIGHACVREREKMRACDESWAPPSAARGVGGGGGGADAEIQLQERKEKNTAAPCLLRGWTQVADTQMSSPPRPFSLSTLQSHTSAAGGQSFAAGRSFGVFLSPSLTHAHTHTRTCIYTLLSLQP